MADPTLAQSVLRRSAVYSYLRPVIEGRRVLEVGCGGGESAAHLLRLGAKSVIAAGAGREVAEARSRHHAGALGFVTMAAGAIDVAGVFDLVVVPDATELLRGGGALHLSAVLGLVAPGGRLACVVDNGDQGDGVSYYDLVDALAPHFSKVRMFGQTPFSAYGIAEFDEAAVDLRVEAELAERDTEEPTHYIALAGPDEPFALGYALVQIPTGEWQGTAPAERAPTGGAPQAPDTVLAEIRQKLVEAEGKAEGLLRVSRAQSEEIEELRARLRRTAESRAELDEEVRRLRHALMEADESVVNLTRKTTEEMTALASRLTAGLRTGEATPAPALTEELRRREEELAARASALSERDDRIAALETAKQEAAWRADAAEDELGQVRAELAALRGERDRSLVQAALADEVAASLKAQEATVEEFRRAAAAHLDEVNRLRDAANEQASLVGELEDELRASESRLAAATAEAVLLRKTLTEVEEADRVRRSRLAELEGLMLRAEREGAEKAEARQRELAELREKVAQGQAELGRLRELESAARAAHAADRARRAELEESLARVQREAEQRQRELAELREQAAKDAAELLRQRELAAAAAAAQAALAADRARLAELEERLSRTEREGAEKAEQRERELAELREQAATDAAQLLRERELAAAAAAAQAALAADRERVRRLEAQLRAAEERERRLSELRAEAPDPEEVYERLFDVEAQYQAATMAAARVPSLEAKLAELEARLAGR
jgi:SAM-dependent methyltransferase/chromosome segregation ATPase